MEIKIHSYNNLQIAEIIAEGIIIASVEDGTELTGTVYYQGVDNLLIYEKNITPAFFDLTTGTAGEMLQKFSNFRPRLAIIGDFSKYPGKSSRDFMVESNRTGHIYFLGSQTEAIEKLSKGQSTITT